MEQFTRPGTTRRFFCGSLLSDSREKWFLFRQVTWLTIGLSATKIWAGWARFRSPGISRRSTLASVLYKHGLWRHRCTPIFDGAKWSANHLLVGGFKHFFSIIYGMILPIDFHIFQRGWNHQPVWDFPISRVDIFWWFTSTFRLQVLDAWDVGKSLSHMVARNRTWWPVAMRL